MVVDLGRYQQHCDGMSLTSCEVDTHVRLVAGLISFTHGFSRVQAYRQDFHLTVSTVSLASSGTAPNGATRKTVETVWRISKGRLSTRLKPGVNESKPVGLLPRRES